MLLAYSCAYDEIHTNIMTENTVIFSVANDKCTNKHASVFLFAIAIWSLRLCCRYKSYLLITALLMQEISN